ncbi:MAG: PD-(D/E)XK nuclease family protein [Verrucomicrobia bacterium]|nr:PD-(D/E)XK nuclease family protein [Verrucomicrobiota bacterium]
MQTVFSHIVQKRLSHEGENVATEALAFLLSREATRKGMMKLLRGIVPQLPNLWFSTQDSEDNNRPDMWDRDEASRPHVFVENKFWAGLTENQPASYLRILEKQDHPTILLVIAPKARMQTLARELERKLGEAGIVATEQAAPAGLVCSFTTSIRPSLALTSWEKLFSFLELELADDPTARNDLQQLRALCDAVDDEAFAPFSAEQVSDQRSPAFVLQLTSLVQEVVALAVKGGILDIKRLNPQADFSRMGRYAYFGQERQVGVWVGIHFALWKSHGGTPLWVVFPSEFGRSSEMRPLLEPWAAKTRVAIAMDKGADIAVALDLKVGEEKDAVVRGIIERLKQLASVAALLRPRPEPTAPSDGP